MFSFQAWQLEEMDAAATSAAVLQSDDNNDALTNFIDNLMKEDDEKREITPCHNDENETSNIWNDIASALNDWTQKLLETETSYFKTETFKEAIETSLQRQQLDGFINTQDHAELTYIKDLWINLLNSISTYNSGCIFVKRDIITFLFGLYKERQITESVFINTCLQL